MKIKNKTVLKNFEGKPYKHEGKELTIGKMVTLALLAEYTDEKIAWKEKLDRYQLATKFRDEKETVTVTAEQLALIERLIGTAFDAASVGAAHAALEGDI